MTEQEQQIHHRRVINSTKVGRNYEEDATFEGTKQWNKKENSFLAEETDKNQSIQVLN